MATPETPGPRAQRVKLGAELRRLRTLAGLSGREVARRTGISQAQVSRMENGEVVPSLPEVRGWIAALRLPREHTRGLEGMAEAALNEVTLIKDRLRAGLPAFQADVRSLESTTRVLLNYQPYMVPGLMQTPDYMRCVFGYANPADDIASAIAVRVARQAILHEPSRSFEFIITESALRWTPVSATAPVLSAQYDRLAVLAGLANVEIGIIPSGVPMTTSQPPGFVVYDERDEGEQPFVIIELPHAAIYASDTADIDVYRDKLSALRRSARYGPEAVAFIRDISSTIYQAKDT
jgi:transcriptional regulator with XRE-family HTH domain